MANAVGAQRAELGNLWKVVVSATALPSPFEFLSFAPLASGQHYMMTTCYMYSSCIASTKKIPQNSHLYVIMYAVLNILLMHRERDL